MPINVSIVEDSDKFRETLARVLNRSEGFRCISHYPNAEDALKALPNDKPEVVLMDINLPGMNGVECVRQLKQLMPTLQVMMLTVYEDTENIFNALAAGATGYMLKRTSRDELLDAIREVHRGGSPMTTTSRAKWCSRFNALRPRRRPLKIYRRANRKCSIAWPRVFSTINRREIEHQLRNRPHLHPAHLRETAGPHAHGSGGEIFAALNQ